MRNMAATEPNRLTTDRAVLDDPLDEDETDEVRVEAERHDIN